MTPAPRKFASPEAASAAEEKTRTLLADLWRRNRPLIEERLAVLESAARAASTTGTLSEGLRANALDVAHKLSGTLGMFGFHQGTVIARDLEQMLDSPEFDAAHLADLARQLRAMLLPSI